MTFTWKKKKTISELRRRVKWRRIYNALSLKKAPSLGLSIAVLLSFASYKIIPPFAFSGFPFKAARWNVPFYILLETIAFWGICSFADTALGEYLKEFVKGKWKSRLLAFFALLLFFPCGVLLLVCYARRKMRWGSIALFVLSLALFSFAVVTDAEDASATISLLRHCAVAMQAPLLIAGLAGLVQATPYRRIQWGVWALSICLGIAYLNQGLTFRQRYVQEDARIWKLLNAESPGTAKAECDLRFEAGREPLAGMVDLAMQCENLSPWEKYHYSNSRAEILSLYEDITAEAPSFRQRLLAFSENCPSPIATPVVATKALEWDDRLDLPEIQLVRYASRFLALEMRARAEDTSVVMEDNAALIRLRDWIVRGGTYSHKLTAFDVERARLNALSYTLPQKRYSKEEWQALLGNAPDWRRISASTSAAAYSRFSSLSIVKNYFDKPFVTFALKCLDSGIFFWDVHIAAPTYDLFVFSDAFLASAYARVIQATLDEKADYQIMRDIEREVRQADENGSVLLFVSGSEGYAYRQLLSIENERRMALIAWRFAEYMHTHDGALPESLAVLGDLPMDAQNSRPFGYERGRLDVPVDSKGGTVSRQGFVLYSHDWDGNLPQWIKAPARIVVFLE